VGDSRDRSGLLVCKLGKDCDCRWAVVAEDWRGIGGEQFIQPRTDGS
jgi:hypothetical protein